jgi:hypothetical protein
MPVVKRLALRRSDTCASCAADVAAGDWAYWDATTRTVRCTSCVDGSVATPRTLDVLPASPAVAPTPSAGASAQREFERRVQRREEAVRAAHPKLGGLLLALFNEPASTQVWEQGASGERAVATKLDELEGEHVSALHDRSMVDANGRRTRANIDHIAVAATGVWVIDAKTHRGALQVRRSGGLFTARVEKLYIAGRDKTSLLDGLARQVDAVASQLASVGASVPVRGALCFVGTELPWFGETIRGVPLVGRRGLAKLLKQPGEFAREDREALATFLASRFPAAV